MADLIPAQCGHCGKAFKLRPDQLGRQVHCPHCKTAVKISPVSDTAREAAAAMTDLRSPKQKAEAKRFTPQMKPGLRSKSVAYGWAAALGVLALAMIIVAAVHFGPGAAGPGTQEPGRPAAGPNVPTPSGAPVYIDPVSGKTTTVPAEKPAEKTTAEKALEPPTTPGDEPVEVERLLTGYKNGTRTFVLGKVTNLTDKTIRAMTISVAVLDAGKTKIGDAQAIIRDLPSGKAIPLVAVLDHAEGAEPAGYAKPEYKIDPAGVAKPPAVIELEEVPWIVGDPDTGVMESGTISQGIFNRGQTPLGSVEISAIMRDAKGKVLGAAKGVVALEKKLPKGASGNVKLPYEHSPAAKIDNTKTQIWIQTAD